MQTFTMKINDQLLEIANKVQLDIEQKVLSQNGVQGTSISTVPGKHDQVCVKVLVDDDSLTTASLGLQSEYEGIPVIISHEKIMPM